MPKPLHLQLINFAFLEIHFAIRQDQRWTKHLINVCNTLKMHSVPLASRRLQSGAIGSLNESHFPTNEVRKLEQGIREETSEYIKSLEDVRSGIDELKALSTAIKRMVESDCADKEDIAKLERKINELKVALDDDRSKLSGTNFIYTYKQRNSQVAGAKLIIYNL